MQTHPITFMFILFFLTQLASPMQRGPTIIKANGVCEDSAGCNCKQFINHHIYGEFTARTYHCRYKETCMQFDIGTTIVVTCEAHIKSTEVCLSPYCRCHRDKKNNYYPSNYVFCSKGETCHGGDGPKTHYCLMYIKPEEICTAPNHCLCVKGKETLLLARTQQCKWESNRLSAVKSKMLSLGVLCLEDECECDSREDHDGVANAYTSAKIKKGSMCFLPASGEVPVEYRPIRSGTITKEKDLMCISDKFDPRNPRTYALCGNYQMCLDHKGRAYCATVHATSLKSYASNRKTSKYGYMVAILKHASLRSEKEVDSKPWQQKKKEEKEEVNLDDYMLQFCFPHEEVEDSILSIRCVKSDVQPQIDYGQICYSTHGHCTCGTFQSSRDCRLGEKCVEGESGKRPTCEAAVARIECLDGYHCPCWNFMPSLSEGKKKNVNKWTSQTPICSMSEGKGEFTSREEAYMTSDEIEEAFLHQIDEGTVTIAPPLRRRLLESPRFVSDEIKI